MQSKLLPEGMKLALPAGQSMVIGKALTAISKTGFTGDQVVLNLGTVSVNIVLNVQEEPPYCRNVSLTLIDHDLIRDKP